VDNLFRNTDTIRLDDHVKTLVRSWNIALILGDFQLRDQAKHILQNLIRESRAFFGLAEDDADQWHSGPSLMAFAARSGLIDLTSVLLTATATDPDLRDWNGRTPLIVAAAYGHVDVVDVLLTSNQVYINSQDVNGWTALLCVTVGRHRETVGRLLRCSNLDVNLQESKHGRTALFCAAENEADDTIDLLLHRILVLSTQ
jgi:ankyrin repeat protein